LALAYFNLFLITPVLISTKFHQDVYKIGGENALGNEISFRFLGHTETKYRKSGTYCFHFKYEQGLGQKLSRYIRRLRYRMERLDGSLALHDRFPQNAIVLAQSLSVRLVESRRFIA